MTMTLVPTAATKERLLEAGMHEFAERGFGDASIRRIREPEERPGSAGFS